MNASITQEKRLEQEILRLLAERGVGQSVCPSEVARATAASDKPEAWAPLLDPARLAAQRLVATGQIVVTQRGRVVDAKTATGPIRLRLRERDFHPNRHAALQHSF
jgi:hypothetical protein